MGQVLHLDALRIQDNALLEELTGLEGLRRVWGDLSLQDNPQLFDLTALANLTEVHHGLGISGNDALVSLTGLEGLNFAVRGVSSTTTTHWSGWRVFRGSTRTQRCASTTTTVSPA